MKLFKVSDKLRNNEMDEIDKAKKESKFKDISIAKGLGRPRQSYGLLKCRGINDLGTLEAIANVMGYDVEIKFVPKDNKQKEESKRVSE